MDSRAERLTAAVERLNTGDVSEYFALCADDLRVRSPLGDFDGRDDYLAFATAGFATIPDHWRTIESVVATEDVVAMRLVFGATSPATERPFRWDAITVYEHDGDRVIALAEHSDPRLAADAFGIDLPVLQPDGLVDLISDAFDCLNRDDVDGYLLRVTGDIVFTGPMASVEGRAAYREYLVGTFSPISDHWRRIRCAIPCGDDVALWVTLGGTAPTGREFELEGCVICTVCDGRIRRLIEYFDLSPAVEAFEA